MYRRRRMLDAYVIIEMPAEYFGEKKREGGLGRPERSSLSPLLA